MKKIIVFITIFSLLLTTPAYAITFVDVEGTPYEDAVGLLSAIGLVDGKESDLFMPAEQLTRAEMVTIILRMLGIELDSGGVEIFDDISQSHWAYNNIWTAHQLGIISGIDDRRFAPDDPVTYPQAVKMLVCAIGYEAEAEFLGGYPIGYLVKASSLGIVSDTAATDTAITRGTMARLVAKAVETEIAVLKGSFSDGGYSFETKKGATVLSEYLGITKYSGKIISDGVITISGSRTRKGKVLIETVADKTAEERLFDIGESGADSYIGQTVDLYVKESERGGDGIVIYVAGKVRSTVTTVDAEDILPNSTTTMLYCERDGKRFSESILSDAVWIHNGAVLETPDPSYLQFDTGTVTLLGSFGGAETVIIYAYENLVANSVRNDEYNIVFKRNGAGITNLVLDETDASIKLDFINAYGILETVEDCKEWDILSAAISEDGDIIRVIHSNDVISGTVEEIGDDEAVIGGVRYGLARSLLRDASINNPELKKPELGMEGNFTLDFTGKIAAVDNEAFRNKKYGYLLTAAAGTGVGAKAQLKIFAEDGKMRIFTIDDNRFKFNGSKTTGAGLLSDDNEIMDDDNIIEQLVQYTADSGDVIRTLDTAKDPTNMAPEEKLEQFTADAFSARAGLIGHAAKMFLTRYLVREETKIFSVPAAYTGIDKHYTMKDPLTLPHVSDGGTYTNVTFYDINEDNTISAFVTVEDVNETPSSNACVGVITKISNALDDDGSEVARISSTEFNKEVTFDVDDDLNILFGANVISDPYNERSELVDINPDTGVITWESYVPAMYLCIGDIIQYDISEITGKATSMRVIFRADSPIAAERAFNATGAVQTTTKDHDYYESLFAYAQIDKASKHGARIYVPSRNGLEIYERIRHFNGNKILLYKKGSADVIKEITSAEVYDGDNMFAFRVNPYERLMVIYR